MALAGESASRENRLSLEITRIFDAPRSLVFKVWSTPSTPCAGGGRATSRPIP